MDIKVWSTPSCVQCMMTKKELDRLGIKYESYDLTEHPDKLEEFKAKGLLQAPIVETDIKVWSGFRIDKIKSLHSFLLGENHK